MIGNMIKRSIQKEIPSYKESTKHDDTIISKCLRLPDELAVDILSRLDLDTLYRHASHFRHLFPQIRRLQHGQYPLDILYPKPSLYSRYLTLVRNKLILDLRWLAASMDNKPLLWPVWDILNDAISSLEKRRFLEAHTPRITTPWRRFLGLLTGLTSLQIELPALPCPSLDSRWFRWDACNYYSVCVIGDMNQEEDEQVFSPYQLILKPADVWSSGHLMDKLHRAIILARRHLHHHNELLTPIMDLLPRQHGKIIRVVANDGYGEGVFHCNNDKTNSYGDRTTNTRRFVIYVPTLTLPSEGNNTNVRALKHVWLVFTDCSVHYGNDVENNVSWLDNIKSYLVASNDGGRIVGGGGESRRQEGFRKIVRQISTDLHKVVLDPS